MPYSPGDNYEPRAVDLNDIETLLAEWRKGRLQFNSTPLVSLGQSSIVSVQVPSSSGVTPGDVLGLGAPVVSPTDNVEEFRANFAFVGAVPSTSTPHYGLYGVVQDAADASGFCRCIVSGVTFVKLNITHASDSFCEIANNVSTSLTTGALGSSRILWKSSGTGSTDKWGLIRVGENSREILVYNNSGGDYATNTSCTTLEVHSGTQGSESATGQTLTAWNRSGVSFKNGKYGWAHSYIGKAYAVPQAT